MKSDLNKFSLTEMQAGLKAKKFSSKELVQSHLNQISKTENLKAFIEVCRDVALQDAEAADKRIANGDWQPLLGVPVAVKDMILTKGVRTTAASKILSNFIPPYDATVVQKLKHAGAITIGKTNMDEFAMGSSSETSAFGVPLNPWDRSRVAGGSSGGSAIAVAACQAPLSLGTDTGGSIRQPASLCGVCGIKPTYGRVSRYGVVAFASSLDQVGTFARNIPDLALATQVISGYCTHDSTSVNAQVPNYLSSLSGGIKGLRVGLPKEYFIKGLNAEVESSVRAAVKALEAQGAKIVEISLPHTELSVAVYYVLAPAEASSNLARYDGVRYGHRAENPTSLLDMYVRSRSEGFGPEVQRRIMVGTYVLSAGYFDAYYIRAQKVRRLISDDFKNAFTTHCDVIACPTAPTTAFKVGEKTSDPVAMYLNDIFTIPVNLAGLPGISIPCGFDSAGLPIGLQLIGKPFDEETLFKVSHEYQKVSDWHTKLPDLN